MDAAADKASKKRKHDVIHGQVDDVQKRARGDAAKAGEHHIIFSMNSTLGCLKEALDIFSTCGVDLKHIESRPDRSDPGLYAFFVTTSSSGDNVRAAIEALKAKSTNVTCLDENPDSTNAKWYPRKISDLDKFADRILSCGEELSSDHPGFSDKTYLARRAHFAKIAIEYRHGEPIPRVEYTPEEIATWSKVFRNLTKLYPTHACAEFNRVFPLLIENCGYREDNIPQLDDISKFLHECTGFRLRPVAGLLSSRDFLAGLAFRVFHSTQYIRHPTKPLYTPEPDVCHEILGHVPLFADRSFAEFSQEIGLASLGASDEDIERLATLYWFTIEFGVCRQNGQLKAYGAGLLSSYGELEHALSDTPDHRPFDPSKTSVQDYPITEYQPVYFVADSFESAKAKLKSFASSLKKNFTMRYNPYTESIELLNDRHELLNLAQEVRDNMDLLLRHLQTSS